MSEDIEYFERRSFVNEMVALFARANASVELQE